MALMGQRWRHFWRVFFLLEKQPAKPHHKWELRQFPELAHFPPGEPSRWMRVRMRLISMWPLGLAYLCGSVLTVAALSVLALFFGVISANAMKLGMALVCLPWFVIMFAAARPMRRIERRLLRRELLRRGIPICVRCGYEPGSWTDRCPECGRLIVRPAVFPE